MSYNQTALILGDLSIDDPLFWNRPTPADCNSVRVIGIFLFLCGFIGLILNGALVYSFIRYKDLRSPPNIFIMFISIIGLLESWVIFTLTAVSTTYCQWLYKRLGCQLEAIMAFLYGCSTSYLLCAVSLSRCYIIVRPFNAKSVTVTKCTIISCIAVLIAFLWTMFPMMGWNEYTIESVRTSCCVNWYDRRMLYISFNIFLFIFVYSLPLIILLITNTIIYLGLKRMRTKLSHGGKADLSEKKIEMERRILKSIIITIFGFVFTWTPYAVVFFIAVFRGKNTTIPPLATFICSCFAKSSVMWIPILYISTSTYFKLTFVQIDPADKLGALSTSAGGNPNQSAATKTNKQITVIQDNKDFTPID